MKQTSENIIVQLASPERKYVKVYHDFLDNSFLTIEEQMIFIVLKSYVDFKEDSGEAYPSMETICKRAKMSEKRARKNINALIKKGIAKKVQRGLTKTNLYTLSDYAAMWACNNVEDVAAITNNQSVKPMTASEHIAELERMGYKVKIKEKGLESDSSQTAETSTQLNQFDIDNSTSNFDGSQDLERYTIDQIRQIFDYNTMLQDHPEQQQDIDTVIGILHTAMNTTKPTIRIAGQDKPAMVVIGKFMKLDKESIMYAIKKFSEQTDKIKNPIAYMTTILYTAQEQCYLDMKNQVNNERSKTDRAIEEKNTPGGSRSAFHNFKQRTYDYDKLEQELLRR